MKYNILFNKKNLLIFFLFSFSLLINQYFGNKGVFPVDSFSHFDTGFRILLGEYPFKNYWVISGPLIDYLQAIFFYFLGVNWQVYIFHASLFNAFLALSTFLVLKNFNLNIYYSFTYSILFSILAYPTSGTPFVDHHSVFFSLLGIYSLILGVKTEKKKYWIFLPIFFGLAFFSKQVPASYVIISVFFFLSIFSIINKKFYWIKYSLLSSIIFIFLVIIIGKIQGITLSSFLEQYIFYPQSIGTERINNFNFTFRGVIGHFKFIYIALLPLTILNIKKIIFEKNYYRDKNFYYFLILVLFSISLIFHQILTKNQTFIFFLIPILFAFSHIFLKLKQDKFSNFIQLTLILTCLFAVTKYHIRFNESRKFHELNYVDFKLATSAKKIDEKFLGLKWITPEFKNDPNEEIKSINKIKFFLRNDNRNKMLMTNYSFFSAILETKLFSTTRWHINDGTDYPQKNSKYFKSYKNLLINSIKNNNVAVIYTISPVKKSNIYDYINENCFGEKKITDKLVSYEIIKCEVFDK